MPKKASSSHEASQSKVIEPLRNSFSIHSAQLQTASSMPVAGGCMNLFVFFSKPCPQTYQRVRTDPLGPDSTYCLAEVTLPIRIGETGNFSGWGDGHPKECQGGIPQQ